MGKEMMNNKAQKTGDSKSNNKEKLRRKANKFIRDYGNEYIDGFCYDSKKKDNEGGCDNITNKIKNVVQKTRPNFVPTELFQKRCTRDNRALIKWKSVLENNLSFEQLESFEGGITVAFINNDFFEEEYQNNKIFTKLRKLLGSDEKVSSVILIKSDMGSSSSIIPQKAFEKLTDNSKIEYRGKEIIINKSNVDKYYIKQNKNGNGKGNDSWEGFLYISIRGGNNKNIIRSHVNKNLTLFNPACEYAAEDVKEDIIFIMEYYMLLSLDKKTLIKNKVLYDRYIKLIEAFKEELKKTEYDVENEYKGNLLDFIEKERRYAVRDDKLYDPISSEIIPIDKFNIIERTEDSIDFTHEEAVEFEKYYWDNKRKRVLSAARPTNVFWSFHKSNMMQQNCTLERFFEEEENRYKKRKRIESYFSQRKKKDIL